MQCVRVNPTAHQLALLAVAIFLFMSIGLLLLAGKAEALTSNYATRIWFSLLAAMPLCYWWMRWFFIKLLSDGRLIMLDTEADSTQLTRQLARLQLTTHSILESSSQGIFGLDPHGVVTFLNPAMCDMLGYREEELVGQSHHELVHHHRQDGSPYPREECPIYQSLETGESARGEEFYIRRDGSSLPVEFVCSPMRENGAWIGAVVFFLDIRDRLETETRLRLASRAFENILEGVIVSDADNKIISVNPAFTRITGYTAEEVKGRNPRFLQSGRQTEEFYQAMWSDLEQQGRWGGEIMNLNKRGEVYPQWLNISRVDDAEGKVTHYIATFTDMSALKASQEQLLYLAYHDALTNLPNRLLFNDRLRQAIKRANRENCQVAILFLDLDHFKHINDTLGHSMGDEVLRQVAARLKDSLREGDTVARLGGDEFIVLLDRLNTADDAALVARKIKSVFAAPFRLEGREFYAGASIGISLYPEDGEDADTLLKNADASMYQAKEMGRNNFQFYTEALTSASAERMQIESDLRHVLERGQLEVFYQPQLTLLGKRAVGAEALLRWNHPELGWISPDKFVPIAEETGLILPIGDWVLRTACNQAREWRDLQLPLEWISVNISGVQVRRGSVAEAVQSVLV